MTENLLKPVVETSYLNAVNVGRYRCVMRCFYEQHQRLRYWLKPEEVFEGVMDYGLLEDYTLCRVGMGETLRAAGYNKTMLRSVTI